MEHSRQFGAFSVIKQNAPIIPLRTKLNDKTKNGFDFIIKPNPAIDYFEVQMDEINNQFNLELINLLGQTIVDIVFEAKDLKIISTVKLPKGIYQVRITTSVASKSHFIIIQ